MALDRREFLHQSLLATAGLGLGALLPRTAHAQSWGDLPSSGTWPTPVKILEIFCYSGLSQWETFWLMEGMAGTVDYLNFDQDIAELTWYCTSPPSPATEKTLFGADAGGNNVYWGPATKPLWRSDIFSRARMVALANSLPAAHALAIPLALTGHRLGNPRAAGLGAAVQHQQMSRAPQTKPYSYVIAPDDIMWEFTLGAAAANGTHPGYAQPMTIRIGDPSFLTLLQRTKMNANSDALLRTYQATEADRLRYQGHDVIRSTGFQSYSHSLDSVFAAPSLYTQLNSVNLTVPMTQPCASAHAKSAASGTIAPQLPAAPNRLQTELTLATSLLTTGGARYVCVIDRGPDREPGGTPYDLHYDDDNQPAARILSNNVFNLCTALADQIDATQTNPSKIHLDDTLIIIHSEFGRTTYRNKDHLGRDHWPGGYAAVLIGGPIKSRAIAGGIAVPVPAPNPGNIYPPPPPTSDALAFGAQGAGSAPFSPTDIRGALMVAAGIDPMAQENFGVGDFSSLIQSQGSESAVRTSLQTQILGV